MQKLTQKTGLPAIRDFLARHGCAPAPWENSENVVERLYSVLREKRHDERFWADLKTLTSSLDDERFNISAMKGSQALPCASADKLLDDLRLSLNGQNGPSGGGLKTWLNRSVGAGALLAFLLLGTATGYGQYRFVPFDDAENDGEFPEARQFNSEEMETVYTEEELAAEEMIINQEILLDLVEVIDDANVPEPVKSDLFKCLPDLDAAYRARLLDMFLEMDDVDLADSLEAMSRSGGVRNFVSKSSMNDDDLDRFDSGDEMGSGADASNPFKSINDACGCGDDDDDDDDDH
jgi:hypothetical protein